MGLYKEVRKRKKQAEKIQHEFNQMKTIYKKWKISIFDISSVMLLKIKI